MKMDIFQSYVEIFFLFCFSFLDFYRIIRQFHITVKLATWQKYIVIINMILQPVWNTVRVQMVNSDQWRHYFNLSQSLNLTRSHAVCGVYARHILQRQVLLELPNLLLLPGVNHTWSFSFPTSCALPYQDLENRKTVNLNSFRGKWRREQVWA